MKEKRWILPVVFMTLFLISGLVARVWYVNNVECEVLPEMRIQEGELAVWDGWEINCLTVENVDGDDVRGKIEEFIGELDERDLSDLEDREVVYFLKVKNKENQTRHFNASAIEITDGSFSFSGVNPILVQVFNQDKEAFSFSGGEEKIIVLPFPDLGGSQRQLIFSLYPQKIVALW